MQKYVCIDIGGTSMKYGLVAEAGDFLDKGEVETQALQKGGPGILGKVKRIVRSYEKDHKLRGVAISTAGMVDVAAGTILYAAPHLIPDYTGMALKEEIEREFSLPCEVENDVNCAGLGEMWLGAGKDAQSIFCLAVGTGIGGCVILDGHLVRGAGNSAGEIGYMHITGGALQDIASTSSLVKSAAQKAGLPAEKLDGKMVFAWAKNGDCAALDALERMLESLAEGIANVCYVLNPEVVILGGGIMAQSEFLAPKLHEALKQKLIPSVYSHTRIAFAQRQNDAGMLGALYHFRQRKGLL